MRRDDGAGARAAIVAGLFLPFHQGATDKSGLGLGLSISARAVESMRGTLVARNLGTGCIFTVELPRMATLELPRLAAQCT